MTTTELVAYIGAAAWLPQIGRWVYAVVVKPHLRFMPASTISLGYSNAGPVVQVVAGLSTERCDALIERIEVLATHERGEVHRFEWVFLGEPDQQLTVPGGETLNFGRSQPATAIKVTTAGLVNSQMRFADPDFNLRFRATLDKILDHYRYLKIKEQNPVEALLTSKEVRDAAESFQHDFCWRAGTYVFTVLLYSPVLKQPHSQQFQVQISTPDSDSLFHNCELFRDFVQSTVLASEGAPATRIQWKWIRPAIRPR